MSRIGLQKQHPSPSLHSIRSSTGDNLAYCVRKVGTFSQSLTMKLFITLFAVVVAVFAAPQKSNDFECMICDVLVASAENWLGHEGENREAAAIAECVKDLKKELGQLGAQVVCNAVVKPLLDKIIAHMEDPTYQHEDADKVCHAIGACK